MSHAAADPRPTLTPGPAPADLPLTFEALLAQCIALHQKKDSDYSGAVPYSNFMGSEEFGLRPDLAVMVRLRDKFKRVCQLLIKEQRGEAPAVTDEALEDTLRDLLNYAGIMLVVRDALRRAGRLT